MNRKYNYVPYPMFMGYTVSYLRSKGVEAIFYDAVAEHHQYKDFYKRIDYYRPEIVIQETATPSFETDIRIAEELGKKYEVCLTGPHASFFADELIKMPFISYILKGEYEYSSYEMIATRRKGIYETQRVLNLDDLPYPYRDAHIVGLYNEPCCRKKIAYPQMWVYGSRGCAYQCNFCLWVHTMYNKKLLLRDPDKIITEVEDSVARFDFKYLMFDDDCWNLGGDDRVIKLANGLQKIGLPWSILGRMDTCDKELFKYLVDRGCVGIRLGVESLSQPLLDKTNKKLKVTQVMDVLNYLKSLDVSVYLCFMHYMPGETKEDRREQAHKIRELGFKHQNPPCIPFPGTPYYTEMLRKCRDIQKVRWQEYDGGNIGLHLERIVSSMFS
ncbi:MAG: radical SAM protein [Candidatus Omnitrophica bacterium]|nr:radical SAM protein [Candidatus Omnitrophota bacterium]